MVSLATRSRARSSSPALLVAGSLLAACSGGGGGGGIAPGGVFIDSAVEGLQYTAGNNIGLTNAQGRFVASAGTTVVFSLGDVVLGLAPVAKQITPITLVPGAVDELDPTVTNLARFLQSLDDDGDPHNGIRITQAVRDAGLGANLQFDQTTANFALDPAVQTFLTAAGSAGLVPIATAQAHLGASLRGSRAGQYVGTYTGDDSGTFNVFVDRSGGLVGCAFSNGDQEVFGVDGTVDQDGIGVFGNTTDQSTFTGTVEAGTISGTWDNTLFNISGTFSGTLREAPELALDPAEIAPFVGTYMGTFTVPGETGNFMLVAKADGDLDITDDEPGEVRATILRIAAGVATFAGVSDDGTQINGTLLMDGTTSGTLRNDHDREFGTFTGSM